jgi:lipopolysaccharide transport system permease protein
MNNVKKYTIQNRPIISFSRLYEIFNYSDLFLYLVKKEVKVLYQQSILGLSWAIIRPVFAMLVFTIIFGGLAKMPSDGSPYALFSYTALVPWTYFSTSVLRSTQSLIANASIITKVYFPRMIIPLVPVVAGLLDFFIALLVTFFLMFWFGVGLNPNIIFIPFLILIMILSSSGIGLLFSALAVQYRDVKHAMSFMIQILMYAAPVVWPVSILVEKYSDKIYHMYSIYPMVGVIEGFRSAIIGNNPMPWTSILIGFCFSIILFLFGSFFFIKKENIFSDVV